MHPTAASTPPGVPVVLVTGASSGVGLAAALELARRGRRLALLARGAGPLERAAEQCRSLGSPSVTVLPTDVRDDDAVARAVAEVLRREGRLDGVVNCAGVVAYGRLEELPASLFDAVVETNLLGSAHVLRHVLPHLRSQRRGSVVLVGSMIGHIAVPTMSAYTVSKWGVRALARQALVENRDSADCTCPTSRCPASTRRSTVRPGMPAAPPVSHLPSCGRPGRRGGSSPTSSSTRVRSPTPAPSTA